MRGLAGLLVACACGRVNFEPTGATVDGSSDAAFATPCSPFAAGWTLNPPVRIDELSSPTSVEAHAFLAADQLTLYFMSDRDGTWDVFRATRPTRTADFGSPSLVMELSSTNGQETGVALARSGLEIYLSTDRMGGEGGADIWRATRQSPDQMFGTPAPVPELSTQSWDYEPTLANNDGAMFYIIENFPVAGTGGQPVVAIRAVGGTWSAPTVIAELASQNNEYGLTTTRDGLAAIVSSDRAAPTVNYDLYAATRSSTGSSFGAVTPVAVLNSPADDGHAFFSEDGCEVFFDSLRSGNGDLFVATWRM